MNQIAAIEAISKYANAPHTVITIDDVPLDVLLNRAHPDRIPLGLVPTLLDWLTNPVERALVWNRFLPANGNSTSAPILMCPDDCDLICTIVIAEIITESSLVWWYRIGIDRSDSDDMPISVGTTVDWLEGVGPFCFNRSDYQRCVEAFKRQDNT
ncbi:MAG: hypothetical protein V4719_29760 [Planctomycetota bacterium]